MRPLIIVGLIACALSPCCVASAQGNPSTDWSSIRKAVWSKGILASQGQPDRNVKVLAVDDSSVTFEDLDRAFGTRFMALRDEVNQVSRWTGYSGSIRGAVLGSVGGLLVGYVAARRVANSFPRCRTSCQVENALVYATFLVPPIAGGVLGYRKLPGNRRLVVIYVRP